MSGSRFRICGSCAVMRLPFAATMAHEQDIQRFASAECRHHTENLGAYVADLEAATEAMADALPEQVREALSCLLTVLRAVVDRRVTGQEMA